MTFRAGALLALAGIGCNTPHTLPLPGSSIEVVSGDQQAGVAGYLLAEPLVVRVVDADGQPIRDATVTWSSQGREAQVSAHTTTTDAAGLASIRFRLGRDDGSYQVTATHGNQPGSHFVALAESGEIASGGGPVERQCARYADDRVSCWERPGDNAAAAVPLDTDLRFATWAYAGDRWCGSTLTGAIACVRDRDLSPAGQFRPEAAPVEVVAQGPLLVRLNGSSPDIESPATWCGIAENLSVWCWGRNDMGQAGPGAVDAVVGTPTLVSDALRAEQVAVTDGASCALDRQGKVWCWGSAAEGVVPGGQDSAQPVTLDWPGRFVQIAADASGNVCALDSQRFVRCWGSGRSGGSGRPGRGPTSEPTLIVGNDIFIAITAGDDGFLGLTVDRTLVVWGGLDDGVTPVRPIDSHVFGQLFPGGGKGTLCLRAFPEGTRCIDRAGLARAMLTPADRPLVYGIPDRGD